MSTATTYRIRPTTVTWVVASVIGLIGLQCLAAPDLWIMTPAHTTFFGFIDKYVWGVFSILVALFMILTPRNTRFLAHILGAFICVMWAGVAFWPSLDGMQWNSISSTVWLGMAVLAIREATD